jgi:hypothetical protein
MEVASPSVWDCGNISGVGGMFSLALLDIR